jgi:hypothetical protein
MGRNQVAPFSTNAVAIGITSAIATDFETKTEAARGRAAGARAAKRRCATATTTAPGHDRPHGCGERDHQHRAREGGHDRRLRLLARHPSRSRDARAPPRAGRGRPIQGQTQAEGRSTSRGRAKRRLVRRAIPGSGRRVGDVGEFTFLCGRGKSCSPTRRSPQEHRRSPTRSARSRPTGGGRGRSSTSTSARAPVAR